MEMGTLLWIIWLAPSFGYIMTRGPIKFIKAAISFYKMLLTKDFYKSPLKKINEWAKDY